MARKTITIQLSILFLLTWFLSACKLTPIEVGCFINELVDAINTANASPNPDIINLEDGCPYIFRGVDNFTDDEGGSSHANGGNALPVITTTITINGNNARFIRDTTQGTPEFRFFKIVIDGDLTLNDLSLENGAILSYADNFGGAIWNDGGILMLNDVNLPQNSATNFGGAIYNQEGEVTINNCLLTESSANGGGAISNYGTLTIKGNSIFRNNSSSFSGGAIYNNKILMVQGTTFEFNSAGEIGGAITSEGGDAQLSIKRAIFNDNTSEEYGGAVYAYYEHQLLEITGNSFNNNSAFDIHARGGALHLSNIGGTTSHIEDNYFDGNSSGEIAGALYIHQNTPSEISNCVFNNNSAAAGSGGAINTLSDTTITSSQFTSNSAGFYGGGIYSNNPNGAVYIDDVQLQSNSSGEDGGGIYAAEGLLFISNSTLQGNQAARAGGGLYVYEGRVTVDKGTKIEENTAQLEGGGISNSNVGDVTLQDSLIHNNTAGDSGGGISNLAVMTIQTSTISGNSAGISAGGLINHFNGDLNILKSTIKNNTALVSAGISHSGVALTILNSTISGNLSGGGTGIYVVSDADIVHTTIAYNGEYGLSIHRLATVNIKNSIVANNSPLDCQIDGTLKPQGQNLDSDGTCTGFTITADPNLFPLANYGGPTETHALHVDSPAIDAVSMGDCKTLDNISVDEDQRGVNRPQPPGGQCDLGAYEFDPSSPPPPPPPSVFLLKTTTDVNCRIGPHFDHVVVHTFTSGETALAIGRNEDGSWFGVAAPDGTSGQTEPWCWLPDAYVLRPFQPNDLPEMPHLPPPNQLIPKVPTEEPEDDKDCTTGTSVCP